MKRNKWVGLEVAQELSPNVSHISKRLATMQGKKHSVAFLVEKETPVVQVAGML